MYVHRFFHYQKWWHQNYRLIAWDYLSAYRICLRAATNMCISINSCEKIGTYVILAVPGAYTPPRKGITNTSQNPPIIWYLSSHIWRPKPITCALCGEHSLHFQFSSLCLWKLDAKGLRTQELEIDNLQSGLNFLKESVTKNIQDSTERRGQGEELWAEDDDWLDNKGKKIQWAYCHQSPSWSCQALKPSTKPLAVWFHDSFFQWLREALANQERRNQFQEKEEGLTSVKS